MPGQSTRGQSTTGSGMMGGAMMGRGGMMGGGMMGGPSGGDGRIDRIEGRIAFLKAELKITDSQMPLWNAYADALRANARASEHRHHVMMKQAATLPDRLDQHEQVVATRLDSVRALKTTLAPLYAALDSDQKKAAEDLMPHHWGMM